MLQQGRVAGGGQQAVARNAEMFLHTAREVEDGAADRERDAEVQGVASHDRMQHRTGAAVAVKLVDAGLETMTDVRQPRPQDGTMAGTR